MSTATAATREDRIRFAGAGVELAGTVLLPGTTGRDAAAGEPATAVPGAVLLSGSGPLDRDSNHRRSRFAVSHDLAQALGAAGVASLRYDKRGVGESPGDWRAAGFHDNVDDAAAAVEILRGRPEVRDDAVFVIGHSEGALLATALAARTAVAGVVLLSGAARTGEEVLRWQARMIAPTLPAPVRFLLGLLRVDLEKKVAANHVKIKATTGDVVRFGGRRLNARWLREFMAYDPARDLARIDVPLLAVTGAKDLQVPPEDLDRVAALAAGPVQTHLVPDVTHTLRRQPGPASLRSYKAELAGPVDAGVLALVTDWLTGVAAR